MCYMIEGCIKERKLEREWMEMKGIDVDSWVPNRGQTRLWFSLPSPSAPLFLSIFLSPFCRFLLLFFFFSSSTHLIHHSLSLPDSFPAAGNPIKGITLHGPEEEMKEETKEEKLKKKRITWHQLVNQLINQQKGWAQNFSPFSFFSSFFSVFCFSPRLLFISLSLFCFIVCLWYSLSNYLVLLWLLHISVFLLSSSSFFPKTY